MPEILITCLHCGWAPEAAEDENEEFSLIMQHTASDHPGETPGFELAFPNAAERDDFLHMLGDCDVCTCPPDDCHGCPCTPGEPTA